MSTILDSIRVPWRSKLRWIDIGGAMSDDGASVGAVSRGWVMVSTSGDIASQFLVPGTSSILASSFGQTSCVSGATFSGQSINKFSFCDRDFSAGGLVYVWSSTSNRGIVVYTVTLGFEH